MSNEHNTATETNNTPASATVVPPPRTRGTEAPKASEKPAAAPKPKVINEQGNAARINKTTGEITMDHSADTVKRLVVGAKAAFLAGLNVCLWVEMKDGTAFAGEVIGETGQKGCFGNTVLALRLKDGTERNIDWRSGKVSNLRAVSINEVQ